MAENLASYWKVKPLILMKRNWCNP